MVELTQVEFLNGIFGIFIVIAFFYMGLRSILKYSIHKDRKLLYFGGAIPFISSPWWSISIDFISILLTGNQISPEIYFLVGYGFPFGTLFWMIVFTELTYKEKQKLILLIFTIFWIVFFVIFFYYFFFTDMQQIGELNRPLTPQIGLYLRVRSIVAVLILLITGFLFYRESHKTTNPTVRLKGTLFLVGILLFMIGAFTYIITGIAFVPLIFFIPSLFSVYGAMLTPEWVKKRLIKEGN